MTFPTDQEKEEVFNRLRTIATALRSSTNHEFIVGYEEGPVMGEGTPFYHITYPMTVLDRLCQSSIFAAGDEPSISSIVMAFDPHMGNYQMNTCLVKEVKEAVRETIKRLHPDASISEVHFVG